MWYHKEKLLVVVLYWISTLWLLQPMKLWFKINIIKILYVLLFLKESPFYNLHITATNYYYSPNKLKGSFFSKILPGQEIKNFYKKPIKNLLNPQMFTTNCWVSCPAFTLSPLHWRQVVTNCHLFSWPDWTSPSPQARVHLVVSGSSTSRINPTVCPDKRSVGGILFQSQSWMDFSRCLESFAQETTLEARVVLILGFGKYNLEKKNQQ